MASDKFVCYPKISPDGKLKMGNQNKLIAWLLRHPGSKVEATFKIMNGSTSSKLVAYYKNYVLEECRKGFYQLGESFTLEEVDYRLRVDHTQGLIEGINEGRYILGFDSVGNKRALLYLEEVKLFASTHLGVIIDDPS